MKQNIKLKTKTNSLYQIKYTAFRAAICGILFALPYVYDYLFLLSYVGLTAFFLQLRCNDGISAFKKTFSF